MPLSIIMMGPCGCGKTEIGTLLAKELGVPFLNGDDFHPEENKKKMGSGIPLTDEDRWPWLRRLAGEIRRRKQDTGCCVECSALRRVYREVLREGDPDLIFVYLRGSKSLLLQRLNDRKGHFMKPGMLDSQLAILEEPGEDENAIAVSIDATPEMIVGQVVASLKKLYKL